MNARLLFFKNLMVCSVGGRSGRTHELSRTAPAERFVHGQPALLLRCGMRPDFLFRQGAVVEPDVADATLESLADEDRCRSGHLAATASGSAEPGALRTSVTGTKRR